MKTYLESEGTAPRILKLCTSWMWVFSVSSRENYAQSKNAL